MSRWICEDDIGVYIGGGYIDIDLESYMKTQRIDIVRCKEYKHWHALNISRPSPCSVGLEDVRADDFCSY